MRNQNATVSINEEEAEDIINNFYSQFAIQLQEELNQNEYVNENFLNANMLPISNMTCTRLHGAQDTHPIVI